jgi:hypothetical protein
VKWNPKFQSARVQSSAFCRGLGQRARKPESLAKCLPARPSSLILVSTCVWL